MVFFLQFLIISNNPGLAKLSGTSVADCVPFSCVLLVDTQMFKHCSQSIIAVCLLPYFWFIWILRRQHLPTLRSTYGVFSIADWLLIVEQAIFWYSRCLLLLRQFFVWWSYLFAEPHFEIILNLWRAFGLISIVHLRLHVFRYIFAFQLLWLLVGILSCLLGRSCNLHLLSIFCLLLFKPTLALLSHLIIFLFHVFGLFLDIYLCFGIDKGQK